MHSSSQTDVSSTTPVSSGEKESVLRRVASMPLVSSTYDMAASAYNSTKNNHPYVKSLCDVAEKGVKTLTVAAVNGAQPILTKLEPQIVTASEYANKRLDTLQEKLPVLQMTAGKVASDTKELVSAKMASAKEAIAGKLFEVACHVLIAKRVLSQNLTVDGEFSMGKLATLSADALLDMSEQLITKYLPVTDRELEDLVMAAPHQNGVPVQERTYVFPVLDEHEEQFPGPLEMEMVIEHNHDHLNEGYRERWEYVSKTFRKRVYYLSLEKMERARENIRECRFRLYKTIIQIEKAKQGVGQKLHKAQEKLVQMWLECSKANSVTKVDEDEVETLTMFQSMIQQLQAAGQSLVSRIQGFPSSLQDKVQQVHQNTGELHTTVSTVGSFQ